MRSAAHRWQVEDESHDAQSTRDDEQEKNRSSFFDKLPPGTKRPHLDTKTHLRAVAHLLHMTDAHIAIDPDNPEHARIRSAPGSPAAKPES